MNEALKNETSYIKETHLKVILLKLNVNSIGNIFEPKTFHNCGETKADSESKGCQKCKHSHFMILQVLNISFKLCEIVMSLLEKEVFQHQNAKKCD